MTRWRRKRKIFGKAHQRTTVFTIISQHSFLPSFSSIFSLIVKVGESTCPTKCSNITLHLLNFCPIISITLCSHWPPLLGLFVAVSGSVMAEI